jgi:hypothetical protein
MKIESETPYVKYQLNGNVLIATFKEGIRIQLEIAKRIVRDRILFTESRVLPVMIRNQGVISIDLQALKFFSSAEGTRFLKAVAFVDASEVGQVMERFLVKTDNASMPVRIFLNELPAWRWLDRFIDKD